MPTQHDIHTAILKEFGLEDMPVPMQQEALAHIAKPVLEAVTLAVMTKLPPEEHEAFEKALLGGDSENVERIVTTHIPDSSAFIESEAAKAIADFKAAMSAQ